MSSSTDCAEQLTKTLPQISGFAMMCCRTIWLKLILASASYAGEATVSTFAEMEAAVASRSTPIHLNAVSIVLDRSLVITYDCTIDIRTNSDVWIDGQRKHGITFQDCTAVVGNKANAHSLTFTRGNPAGVVIQSIRAPTRIEFNCCKFTYAVGNGLNIAPSKGPDSSIVEVTCADCQANSNWNDGFSLFGGGNRHREAMTLINCSATNNDAAGLNDPNQSGNGAGDGVTSHEEMQVVHLLGGTYWNNGKMGAAICGGSELYAKGVTFYENNRVMPLSNVYVNGSKVFLDECTFLNLNGNPTPYNVLWHIYIDSDNRNQVRITNCTFRGRISDPGGMYVDANGGDVLIEGCTFTNNCQDGCETVRLDTRLKSVTIRNCVFHNVAKALSIETPLAVIQNSVFDSIASYAVSASESLYANQPTNGHNLFFRVGRGFAAKDQYKTSDIRDLDPGFVDPAQCDFRLKAGSPCLNAGLEAKDHKRSNIGAWQGMQPRVSEGQ